jgi:glucokinase
MADGVLVNGPLFMLGQAGKLEPESVYRCAEQGDPFAQRLFERMGWSLGLAIANLFTFLGIRHAIIGGGVSAGWDRFIGPLHESLAGYSSMLAPDEMVVRQSSLGDDAALIGAARLAWQHFEGT